MVRNHSSPETGVIVAMDQGVSGQELLREDHKSGTGQQYLAQTSLPAIAFNSKPEFVQHFHQIISQLLKPTPLHPNTEH